MYNLCIKFNDISIHYVLGEQPWFSGAAQRCQDLLLLGCACGAFVLLVGKVPFLERALGERRTINDRFQIWLNAVKKK